MEKIILIGGGGHCKSCIDVIEQTGLYEIVGIIDIVEKVGQSILGYKIIGTDIDIESLVKKKYSFLITIGQIKTAGVRIKFYQMLLSNHAKMPVIISPFAYVSKFATLGQGTIVMHHAIVNASAIIGCCNIINTNSLLEHEVVTGDMCHISTATILNGQVKVGNNCFIGSNAVINNNIQICDNVIISSSSRISKNVLSPGTYYGS